MSPLFAWFRRRLLLIGLNSTRRGGGSGKFTAALDAGMREITPIIDVVLNFILMWM